MHDYKPSNMLVDRVGDHWQVTGLFDLMEAYFGHGESDLSRMFCFYVGVDRPDLAHVFVATYSKLLGDPIGLPGRFTPFVIHDRAIVWESRQRHPHTLRFALNTRNKPLAADSCVTPSSKALRRGLREIQLYTNGAMTDNIGYYKRAGYEEIARRTEQGFRRAFMRKVLSPGTGSS